jgi:hypothetical protein
MQTIDTERVQTMAEGGAELLEGLLDRGIGGPPPAGGRAQNPPLERGPKTGMGYGGRLPPESAVALIHTGILDLLPHLVEEPCG